MTIRLYPCAATVICGPCVPCKEFHDLSRTGPDARVVYVTDALAVSFVSGTVTYNTGGPPTVVGMSIVGATQKMCLGRNQSVNGPLLYVSSVPTGATITDVAYTYNNGVSNISVGGTATDICTNYLTQITRVLGSLDCDAAPTVVLLAASCAPCTEATGSSSSTGGGAGGQVGLNASGDCVNAVCGPEALPAYGALTLRPPSWTPGAGARPCNWTGLAFVAVLTSAYKFGNLSCSGTFGIDACVVTYTKNAGDNQIYVTSAANNCSRSSSAVFDSIIRTGQYPLATNAPGLYDIPCTGYKLRQYHPQSRNPDICLGGSKAVPGAFNQITTVLEPR